jgi:murein DD-endopeptidase MepM/ murein hydrolase activator NlpD
MKRIILRIVLVVAAIVLLGLIIPQNLKMPVVGADSNSYNHKTFWYEGWGTSIVHKGIDVFAKRGTRVNSATWGVVIATAEYGKGGKFIVVLGPKWRLHYYAHLDEIKTKPFSFVTQDTEIGTVGNTGNAITTPAHLHYGIGTLIPYLWRIDDAPLGWQKMFYLNPIDYLQEQ